jgi:uncharacterized protein YjbI with pentapeptide repeats
MVEARRAPVRPRVLSPLTGDTLLFEDEVRALLEAKARGVVQLIGPAGSGKTTALLHIAALLRADSHVALVDEAAGLLWEPLEHQGKTLVIYATKTEGPVSPRAAAYRLAPWGEDECLEYLLAMHREACASVMARLRAAKSHKSLMGIPELWRIVLDEMAADQSVPGVRDALRRFLAREMADGPIAEQARTLCLNAVSAPKSAVLLDDEGLRRAGASEALLRVLRHAPVQLTLAVECILAGLLRDAAPACPGRQLPPVVIQATAEAVARSSRALERLKSLVQGSDADRHAMAASILHATDTGWIPHGEPLPNLAGAYLPDVAWPYIKLAGAELSGADLSRAYLRGAVLDRVCARKANLREACLQAASLQPFVASAADLTGADLSSAKAERAQFQGATLARAHLEGATLCLASFESADLTEACFLEADLGAADFTSARITGADFTGANLEAADLAKLRLREATLIGARFTGADVSECDMEYVQLPGADFSEANLHSALLTGSWIPEGRFGNACLARAGLADINWEGADLRNADLRGATFHAGSSRSGMIFSPIPSEGSKTGFYTDDSEEQHFKRPEEVRKANLRGADLRGAWIDGVDFYLVDLRDALFDPEQEAHFRRCRAILEARV